MLAAGGGAEGRDTMGKSFKAKVQYGRAGHGRRVGALLCTTALALTLPMGLARAQSVSWNNGGTGDWNAGANWSAGVPTTALSAFFTNGGTAEISSGTNAEARVLSLGGGSGTSGNLIVQAGGDLALSGSLVVGNNGVAAPSLLDIDGGTLFQAGGSTWIETTGRLVLRNGGTIDVSGNNNGGVLGLNGGTLVIGDGGGDILATSIWGAGLPGQVIFDNSDNSTFSTLIEGIVEVVHNGSGTTTLSGNQTYTGGTTLNAGVLSVSQNANLGASGGALTFNGGTLQTTAGFSMNRATSIGAGGGTFDVGSGTLTQAGVISGSGALDKTGAGTLTLTGNSPAFSGTTTVSEGTLRLEGLLGGLKIVEGDSVLALAAAGAGNTSLDINDNAVVNAVVGNAIGGGTQYFWDNSVLNASAANAVSNAYIYFWDSNTFNITAASGLSGGYLVFLDDGVLNASAIGAISGGEQDMEGTSVLNASAANAVNGGEQNFYNDTALNATAADAVSGGLQTFGDRAVLNATVAGAVSGGIQTFSTDARLNVLADNALTGATDVRFERVYAMGDIGGVLALNGHDTTIGRIDSIDAGAGVITNGGADDSLLSVDTSAGASGFSGVIQDGGGTGRLGLALTGGTLTLSGANTYTGGTVVDGGILRAGAAGAFVGNTAYAVNGGTLDLNGFDLAMSSLSGAGGTVALGTADLTVNQMTNTVYTGVFTGSGDFIKSGTGTLTLTGDSSAFSGATTVGSSGSLVVGVAGSGALGGALTISAGGRLGGTGTVGTAGLSTIIAAGAAHAPGNSVGVQHIAGDYANHGTLVIEATPTAADQLVVAGAVDITGATLELLLSPADAASWNVFNGPFIIIDKQSAGAVVGTFGPVISNLLFLDTILDYAGGDGNDVALELLRNDVAFASAGITRNQIAAGTAIEALGSGNPVWNAVALAADPDLVRASFDALSGEVHASMKTALIEDSRFIRNAVNDRIRTAFDGVGAADSFAFWGQAFGSWGHIDDDGNAASLDRSTGGLLFGADTPLFDVWRFGAVAGYSNTNFDVTGRQSSGSSDNYHLGLYGGAQWGDLALRTGAAYTAHDISTTRIIAIPGVSDSLKGDYDAGTAQVFGEFGYRMQADNVAFEPFANLAYVNIDTGGFTEQGGAAALTGASVSTDATFTTLGLRASTIFDLDGASLTAKGMVGWRHAFGGMPESTVRFAGGNAFIIAGVPVASDAALVEAGLDLAITSNTALGASYNGQFGSGIVEQSFKANLNARF